MACKPPFPFFFLHLLDDPYPRTQLNVRVRSFSRTALTLVSMRYNVRAADVIGLAPLLFLITAELSLRRRKSNLDAIWEQVFNLEDNSAASAPHMAPVLNNIGTGCQDNLFEEEESIKQRDVFNRQGPYYDVEDHCPYTTYLQSLAKDLLKENDVIQKISPPYNDIPNYAIALDTLCEVTGIGGDTKRDQELRDHILKGGIDLSECVSQRKELSSETYDRWLDQKLAEAKEEERARFVELWSFDHDSVDKEDGETN